MKSKRGITAIAEFSSNAVLLLTTEHRLEEFWDGSRLKMPRGKGPDGEED